MKIIDYNERSDCCLLISLELLTRATVSRSRNGLHKVNKKKVVVHKTLTMKSKTKHRVSIIQQFKHVLLY